MAFKERSSVASRGFSFVKRARARIYCKESRRGAWEGKETKVFLRFGSLGRREGGDELWIRAAREVESKT